MSRNKLFTKTTIKGRTMPKPKKRPEDFILIKWFQKVTTIHGTSHFSSKKSHRLLLWCTIMVSNMVFTAAFIMVIKEKFIASQLVTQINANCKVSQVPFPSVSICNFNGVSMREAFNIIKLLNDNKISQKQIQDFVDALTLMSHFDKRTKNVGNFSKIMSILKSHYFTIDSIMQEVHQNCDALIIYCTFNRKPKKCDNLFRLTKTSDGYCCVFNYFALNDASDTIFYEPDEDLEYYYDQNEKDSLGGNIVTTTETGSDSGLRVLINVEPSDYPGWSLVQTYGAKILLADPNDYIETSVVYRYITIGQSVDIKVKAMLFQSEDDVQAVDIEKRGCAFYDEVLLENTDRYSYETCYTECRMKNYMEKCGCMPYKYPISKSKSTKICEFDNLKCLHNVTGKHYYIVNQSKKDLKCNPVCYIECRDKKYEVDSDLVPFLGMGIPKNFTKGYNLSQLAELKVYYGRSNINCYKLTLLTDFNYFVATYGGIFSLTFGGSLLTLCELVFIALSFIFRTINTYFKSFTVIK